MTNSLSTSVFENAAFIDASRIESRSELAKLDRELHYRKATLSSYLFSNTGEQPSQMRTVGVDFKRPRRREKTLMPKIVKMS